MSSYSVHVRCYTCCAVLILCVFITPKQKLPFTIPELVQASPCRSSDGILYMGKNLFLTQMGKQFFMLVINR